MHHLSDLLSSIAGLLFFYGAFFRSPPHHGTRRMRYAYAGGMGAVFALNMATGVGMIGSTPSIKLLTFVSEALGLLGCVRVLVGAVRDRGATGRPAAPPTPPD